MFDKEMSDEYPPLVYCEDLSRNGALWNSVAIGTGKAVLLSEGDYITIRGVAEYTFHAEYQPVKQQIDEGEEIDRRLFADRYQITSRKLGAGGNGAVYMAINQLTKHQVACKILSLPAQHGVVKTKKLHFGARDLTDEDGKENIKAFLREVKILQSLSHPNIMGLEKVYRSERTMYIFQELLTGGDLFSYVDHKGSLSDTEAAVITRQVLKALEYLHGKNIAHRDLKPDNILMTSTRAGSRAVLTDFGCAREIEDNSLKRMTTVVGTTEYIAPEIHASKKRNASNKGYTKSVDMWALGVVTYVLLTTNSFLNEMDWKGLPHDQRIFKAWHRCISSIEGEDSQWTNVGPRPKDFLKKLLVLDEDQRMTVQDALSHSWFTNKAHKAEFEAVYRRATDGWKPTCGGLSQNAIEIIGSACPPQHEARVVRVGEGGSGTVSSTHFPPKSLAALKKLENPYTPPSPLTDTGDNGATISSFAAQQKIGPSRKTPTDTFLVPAAKMYKPVHPTPPFFKGGFKVPFPKYNTRSNRDAPAESPGCHVGAKRTVDEIGKSSVASEHSILPPKKQCLRESGYIDSPSLAGSLETT